MPPRIQDKMYRYPPGIAGKGRSKKRRGGGPLPPTPYLGGKMKGKGLGAILGILGPLAGELLPRAVRGISGLIKKAKAKKLAKRLAKAASDHPKTFGAIKDVGKKLLNKGVNFIKKKTSPDNFQKLESMYNTGKDAYKADQAMVPSATKDVGQAAGRIGRGRCGGNASMFPRITDNITLKQKAMNPHAYLAHTMNKLRTNRKMMPRPMQGIKFDKPAKGGSMKGPIP